MQALFEIWGRSRVFTRALFAMTLLAMPAQSATFTWNGEGRSWHETGNWTPAGIPGVNDSAIIGPGFTIQVASDVKVNGLTIGKGTRLTGSGHISLTGSGTFTDARLSGTGDFRVEVGATLRIITQGYSYGPILTNTGSPSTLGNINTRFDRAVFNFGAINWDGGNLLLYNSLQNAPNSAFRIRSAGALVKDPQAPSTVIHAGAMIKSVTGTTTFTLPYTNSGALTTQAGTMSFTNGFTQTAGATHLRGGTLSSTGTMTFSGGRLDGSGTVQSDTVNRGAVFAPGNSPGSVVINGNYIQAGNGILEMEVGGVTPGSAYDQLVVNGTATLGGTLNIMQFNGFVPVAGNSFQLVKYFAYSGDFASVNNLFTSPGNYFTTVKTPSYLVAQTYADGTLPTVTVTAPINDKGYASFTTATGTASDATSGLSGVTTRLYRYAGSGIAAGYWNGATWDAAYSVKSERPTTGTTSWTATMPALGAAKYSLIASAKDKANNLKASSEFIFWIDTTVPAAVAITSPARNAFVNNLNSVSGTMSDAGSGIKRVDLRIKKVSNSTYWNGSAWVAGSFYVTTVLKGDTWSRTTGMPSGALLPAGSYELTALAVDKADLLKSSMNAVTVQAAAPLRAESTHLLSAQLNGNSMKLTFSAPLASATLPDARWTLQLNGEAVVPTGIAGDGKTVSLNLPAGGAVPQGAVLSISWQNLRDAWGESLAGSTSLVVSHQ